MAKGCEIRYSGYIDKTFNFKLCAHGWELILVFNEYIVAYRYFSFNQIVFQPLIMKL